MCRRARSRSSSTGGSETMFSDSGTAACTCAYDMPLSIAAKSSPQRNSHDAAPKSRANASGSAIAPLLNLRSSGNSKPTISVPYLREARRGSAGWIGDSGHPVGVRDAHLALETVGIPEEDAEDLAEVGHEQIGRASCRERVWSEVG